MCFPSNSEAPLPLQSSQYTISYFVDPLAILTGAGRYLTVLLLLISLVARDGELLLSALLAIFIFSIENSLLRCLVPFSLIGLFP